MNKFLNKNNFYYIAIALAIAIFFSVDRTLKALALNFKTIQPFQLIGDILSFQFTANSYMAFSLPLGGLLLNTLIIVVIVLLLIYIIYLIFYKDDRKLEIILLSIIFTGALSNIFDRLIYGYVIDYLELKYFTVFNLADVMISGGAIILILKNLKNKETIS
ncbi:MAG: signal peptidase II [Patescibacteria group bacterium]|jgi:signal peptidase II